MQEFFVDLHIHIGRTSDGRPVKVTAARDLTLAEICRECVKRKGINVVGIIDCASPAVLRDLRQLMEAGELVEMPGGGLRYRDKLTVIPGAEMETAEPNGGGISHHLNYFPTLEAIEGFSRILARHVTNLDLSSQQCRMPAADLVRITRALGGFLVPSHAFTPHKGALGSCVRRLAEMFPDDVLDAIPAVELGLSADTDLADRIGELADFTFVSNSDAHSLPKIGREYNIFRMGADTFEEIERALRRGDGLGVVANFGLDPRLGKYHRTFCEECQEVVTSPPPTVQCNRCGGDKVTMGVLDRIMTIADCDEPRHPAHRPPYRYQVPLQFVPKVGPVTLNKLLNRFGSEMAVLHRANETELAQTVGAQIARDILRAREGTLPLLPGGGGRYGKAIATPADAQLGLGL